MILDTDPEHRNIILEGQPEKIDSIDSERQSVIHKINNIKLGPNERKKIVSKKHGKWLTMTDENGVAGVL